MFQKCFKGVSRVFQWFYQKVSRVSHESFDCFSMKFSGCFQCVHLLFLSVWKKFQGCFKEVLFCNFVVACPSSQLTKQKNGLFFWFDFTCFLQCFKTLFFVSSSVSLSYSSLLSDSPPKRFPLHVFWVCIVSVNLTMPLVLLKWLWLQSHPFSDTAHHSSSPQEALIIYHVWPV